MSETAAFFARAVVYALSFAVSFWALGCIDYEKLLKKGHVPQAQLLYWLVSMALAYLSGSFLLSFTRIG